MSDKERILELASDLVAAYVSHNDLEPQALPELVTQVYRGMLDALEDDPAENAVQAIPAVPIEQSISDDYIICLEDGQKYKSLKRHLRTKFDLTPKLYREKWGLPADYPMVAKNYSKERSRLAKRTGLGRS